MRETTKRAFIWRTSIAAALTGGLLLGGCASTSDEAPQMQIQEDVKTSGNTAPVELQLACASEAGSRLGLGSDSVLPTGSAEVQPGTYRVELTSKSGASAECIINQQGEISSVARI
jgi:hypothetical protein